jgi:aconitate hydratase
LHVNNKNQRSLFSSVSNKYGIWVLETRLRELFIKSENYAFLRFDDRDRFSAGECGGLRMLTQVLMMPGRTGRPGIRVPKWSCSTGKLSGWMPEIIWVPPISTVKGGTGAIVEYFGEGALAVARTEKELL